MANVRTLLGVVAAASIGAFDASAAMLTTTAIVGGQSTSTSDPLFSESAITGFATLDDLTIDEARARADLARGELKYLVRDGGVPSFAPVFGAVAGVTMRETLTLTASATGAAELFTIGMSFDAAVDTALATAGGTLNQVVLADGASVNGRFQFVVIETVLRNGIPVPQSQEVRATFSQGTAFRFNEQGVQTDQFFFQAPRGIAETFPIPSNTGTRVVETRAHFDVVSEFLYTGILEFDLLVAGSHTFDFIAGASGNAEGAAARSAGINAFNTASLFVNAPVGGSFTSASGAFLTAAPSGPVAVPLPAPAFLLAGPLAALAFAARRRQR